MNITTLKSELAGILHGTTINKVTNLNGVINRAGRKLLLDIDPVETVREIPLGPVYDSVYDYACPTDLKGNGVIDIKPQINRTLRDRYPQTYSQEFDIMKDYVFQPNYNVNNKNGIKTLRIDTPLINTGIVLTEADTLTGNDTWAGATFTIDNVNYASGSGAITFDVPASSPFGITDVMTTPVDLSTHENQSVIGFYIFLPTAADITSIQFGFGSSIVDGWISPAITLTNEGLAFTDGWNFLTFNWKNCSVTGTPVSSAIKYLALIMVTNTTAQTAVKINNFVSRLGQQMNIRYYSKYLFRDYLTNVFQETITSDSNIINLDTESYNLLLQQTALQAVQQAFDGTANTDTAFFQKQYDDSLKAYKGMYKSEKNKPKVQYYRKPSVSWRRFFGRGYNL